MMLVGRLMIPMMVILTAVVEATSMFTVSCYRRLNRVTMKALMLFR